MRIETRLFQANESYKSCKYVQQFFKEEASSRMKRHEDKQSKKKRKKENEKEYLRGLKAERFPV
jgi:hypothetical protein